VGLDRPSLAEGLAELIRGDRCQTMRGPLMKWGPRRGTDVDAQTVFKSHEFLLAVIELLRNFSLGLFLASTLVLVIFGVKKSTPFELIDID
jgi:hypothetical protein